MGRKFFLLWIVSLGLAGLQGCGSGSGSGSGGGAVTISLSPKLAAVAAAVQSQQFTATVSGPDQNVEWSVDGVVGGNSDVGVITGGGVYFAPPVAGTHTITVTAGADTTKTATATVAITDLPGVLTYHNNLARDGTNTQEYALTSSTVTTAKFGKLFSCPVDGAVYTQPLWVPGLNINGVLHNVLYVATQHDSVYAFDADASPCAQIWKVNLLDTLHGGTSGEGPVPCDESSFCAVGQGAGDIQPEIGVTGTPVINLVNGTIYVVSKSYNSSTPAFFQRLHALDLNTGDEKLNGPLNITASVPGLGDGSSLGMLEFNLQSEHQRSGLALAGDRVFVAWAAHEDAFPYHGWLLSYSAKNLLVPPGVFNSTPNGGLGGIWSAGGAPAVDDSGAVYVATGNGIFDANVVTMPNNDFGDSLLKLDPADNLNLLDWFTPDDQQMLADQDADLGSGAIVLLPDQTTGPPHLMVEVGKGGVAYLVDRDNMGQFQPSNNDQIVQSFDGARLWGTPALWQNNLYFGGAGNGLMHFTFDPSTGLFDPSVASQSTQVFNFPGATPSVSSQGTSNGIVWAVDTSAYGPPAPSSSPAVLHAYSASNLATEYWNSTMAANKRDQAGNAVKFVVPTIANGKVYLSTRTEITVYGLLPN